VAGDANAREVKKDDVADVVLETTRPLVFDVASRVPPFGRFVVVDGYDVAGGGIVTADAATFGAAKAREPVSAGERARRIGHHGRVVVVAVADEARLPELERALFERGVVARVARSADEARALAAAGLVALVVDAPAGTPTHVLPPLGDALAQTVEQVWDAVRLFDGGRDGA
jgi:hypothetical protein